jgi:two-component system, chemotaxis family, chemotaxis protein CheY
MTDISSSGNRVLIVDDDVGIREALTMILEDEGYEVSSAANGQLALDWLVTHSSLPNLILLDLMMPIMNGWEFHTAMRKEGRFATIPVIVLSADSNMAQKAQSLQAQGYLAKPVDIELLLSTVNRYCHTKGS